MEPWGQAIKWVMAKEAGISSFYVFMRMFNTSPLTGSSLFIIHCQAGHKTAVQTSTVVRLIRLVKRTSQAERSDSVEWGQAAALGVAASLDGAKRAGVA